MSSNILFLSSSEPYSFPSKAVNNLQTAFPPGLSRNDSCSAKTSPPIHLATSPSIHPPVRALLHFTRQIYLDFKVSNSRPSFVRLLSSTVYTLIPFLHRASQSIKQWFSRAYCSRVSRLRFSSPEHLSLTLLNRQLNHLNIVSKI
jgi:hypothetical protein